jgi:hypothetical protein
MAGTTNILVFNPSQANQETDAAYLTDATRTGGAGVDGIWPSNSANKTLYQISTVVAALAQMMANKNFSISDSNYAVLVAQLSNILTTTDLRSGVQALVWSPSITLNAATFAAFAVPLQGATTLLVTGATAGQVYVVIYTQDSVGGHTVTFSTGFTGGDAQPDPTIGISSIQVFVALTTTQLAPVGPLISAGGVNNTPIGNSSPSTGAFTTLAATTVSATTGAFTTLTSATPASSDNSTKTATTAWSKLGFAISLAANGYIKLPNWLGGFIIQWCYGTGCTTGGLDPLTQSITFPLMFPTACFAAFVSTQISASTADGNCMFQTVGTPTQSYVNVTFQIMTDTGGETTFTPVVFAVGY